MPVGTVEDPELLELFYCATDIYLDAYPTGSLTAVLDAARHALPVQRLNNRDRCLLWCDDPALDSVMLGASTQDEYIATVLEWLTWPEEKRSELGMRFRNAVLEGHCGASWKRKWLDPAINALVAPSDGLVDSRSTGPQQDDSAFPGLGVAGPESDWPPGMFVAGTILSDDEIPRAIRISGVVHSIKPLLFNTPRDGTLRKRLSIFRTLVASCLPMQVRTMVRRMRYAIFTRLRQQRESAD